MLHPINQGIIKAPNKILQKPCSQIAAQTDVKWTQQQIVLAWCCDNASDSVELSYLKNHCSFMKTEFSASGQDEYRRE